MKNITVTGCKDCPFCRTEDYREHSTHRNSDYIEHCDHPQMPGGCRLLSAHSGDGKKRIKTPESCPLIKEPICIAMSAEKK